MKKSLIILIALCLILFLCGCSQNIDSVTDAIKNNPVADKILSAVNNSESQVQQTAPATVTITFPEGFTLVEIAERLEENGVCPATDFMELTTNKEYLSSLDYPILVSALENENVAFYLEGFVFPDTYEFYIGESAETALSRFLMNTNSKITQQHIDRAEDLGYTVAEILTIASVIQEEASDPKEMPYVSSVVHNRLISPGYGKLQCDVTIHYVNNNITNSPYLEGDTSVFAEYYNTYKCDGLPAGPICNPGLDAIEAALYPADTNYFFFVTDADWNYYYAETYSEHLQNCKKAGL